MKISVNRSAILFLSSILSFAMLSPKWLIPLAAWFAPALLLFMTRQRKPFHVFLISFFVLYFSSLIGNYRVIPFPFVFLLIVSLQTAVTGSIPYVLYSLVLKHFPGWTATFAFPVLMVVYDYVSSFSGGGSWGSIAYSQIENLALMQLVSITGIWGVTFLIYWFAAIINWTIENRRNFAVSKLPIVLYGSILTLVILFGMIRLSPVFRYEGETVRVSAITASNIQPLLAVYEDVFKKKLVIDPLTLTQTSPELAELNKALAVFIESPMDLKYAFSRQAMTDFQDSLFRLAGKEAVAGSKIISFSEALMLTIKPEEGDLIQRGKNFAKTHKVRLLLTLGTFLPGKIEFGKKYIENKAIMINESGDVENIFFKNKPVPLVEGSVPGDGEVPVIKTTFANLGVSICYDADFPSLMQKAGKQHADILFLPSGDWKEIAPYHADMARVRAIENGFSLVRPVSGATTIACDFNGRVIGRKDFYDPGERIMVTSVPTKGTVTVYSLISDSFAFLCIACTLLFAGWLLTSLVNSKRNPARIGKASARADSISESRSTHH